MSCEQVKVVAVQKKVLLQNHQQQYTFMPNLQLNNDKKVFRSSISSVLMLNCTEATGNNELSEIENVGQQCKKKIDDYYFVVIVVLADDGHFLLNLQQ